MGLGELLQQGPENLELCLQGLRVGGPEGRAVGGVLSRCQPAAVKGREADTFAGHCLLWLVELGMEFGGCGGQDALFFSPVNRCMSRYCVRDTRVIPSQA